MSTAISILLLHGDAEAKLLADGDIALQAVFADRDVQLVKAWMTRPDWLQPDAPAPPAALLESGALADARMLLEQPHKLVIFSLLPAVTMPALRHSDGSVLLAHQGLADEIAPLHAKCVELPPLTPAAAAAHIEPVIDKLQSEGIAVALCTTLRHVDEPLAYKGSNKPTLRTLVRQTNLEIARLSQRTGCFVLDLDRPLAQEGGLTLNADCFGGEGRAAEIALDELAAVALDALPDEAMPLETP